MFLRIDGDGRCEWDAGPQSCTDPAALQIYTQPVTSPWLGLVAAGNETCRLALCSGVEWEQCVQACQARGPAQEGGRCITGNRESVGAPVLTFSWPGVARCGRCDTSCVFLQFVGVPATNPARDAATPQDHIRRQAAAGAYHGRHRREAAGGD